MMSDYPPPAADVDDGNNSPQSRRPPLPSPWASVVRGDSDQNSSPLAAAESVAPEANLSPPPSEQASGSDDLIEISGSEAQPEPESSEVNGDSSNAGQQRRPAWSRPANGVVEPASVMGGAVSWPALSETTRPVSRSISDNSRPVSEVTTLPQPPQQAPNNNANANSAVSNPMHSRPRSRNRNGGSSAGIGLSQHMYNSPPLQMPPPFPYGMVPAVVDASVRGTRPIGGHGGSPSHSGNENRNNSSRRVGGYGGRPRGDGQYHNSHGGRRDQGRRDVHHPLPFAPPPPSIGYMPSHLPPGVPPFIAPPPVRVFPGQMGFDMAPPPFIYYPTMPPESFRPMPMVPPTGPPPFPTASEEPLTNMILKQIDFYFSDDNLVKDNFLRSKMDDQGWVAITLIASFRRVQQLTQDISLILDSLRYSTVVEVQGDQVRRRNEWRKWLPPPNWPNSNSGPRTSSAAPVNELANSLQGVSLGDTTAKLNGSNDGMEGYSGRTGQSGEEVHAISV